MLKRKITRLIAICMSVLLLIPSLTVETAQAASGELDRVNAAMTVAEMRSALEVAKGLKYVPIQERVIYKVEKAAANPGSIGITTENNNDKITRLDVTESKLNNAIGATNKDITVPSNIAKYLENSIKTMSGFNGSNYTVTANDNFLVFKSVAGGDMAPNVLRVQVNEIDLGTQADAGQLTKLNDGNGSLYEKYKLNINGGSTDQLVTSEFSYPDLRIAFDMTGLTGAKTKSDIADAIASAIANMGGLTNYSVTKDASNDLLLENTLDTRNKIDMSYQVKDDTGIVLGNRIRIPGSFDAYANLSTQSKDLVAQTVLFYRKGAFTFDSGSNALNGTYEDNNNANNGFFGEAVRVHYIMEKAAGTVLLQNAIEELNAASSDIDLKQAIEKNSDYLGLLVNRPYDYGQFTTTSQTNVAAYVRRVKPGTGFSTVESIQTAFNRAVSIELINTTDDAALLRQELEKLANVNVLNLDLTDYNLLMDKPAVALDLTDEYFTTYKQVKDAFQRAVIVQRDKENQQILSVINRINSNDPSTLKARLEDPAYIRKIDLNINTTPASSYDGLSIGTKLTIMQKMLDLRDTRPQGTFENLQAIKVAFETAVSDITGTYVMEPKNGTTGILSGVNNKATITFNNPVYFTSPKELLIENGNIKVIEQSTGNNVLAGVELNYDQIVIRYNKLKPSDRYTVYIQPNTLKRGSEQITSSITWTFYTEKKPEVREFLMFAPDGEMFTYPTSIFATNSSRLYQIPELMGVQRVGVGVNQALVVSFNNNISFAYDNPNVSVEGKPTWSWSNGPATHLPETSLEIQGKELIVKFINNNDVNKFLEYGMTYTVTLPPGIVKSSEGGTLANDRVQIKFTTVDGFKNTLMDGRSQNIDELFQNYAPRNIAVKVPKVYIQKIETIHRNQGVAASGQAAPNLTNVDIYTDGNVDSVRVVTDQGVRSNLAKNDGRFSTAFVGLAENTSNLSVYAYDKYGKLLEKRSFKLGAVSSSGSKPAGGKSAQTNYVKGDYIPAFTSNMGKTHSLYEIMKDPAILEEVLQHVPVSELDRLGMFYPAFSPYSDVPIPGK